MRRDRSPPEVTTPTPSPPTDVGSRAPPLEFSNVRILVRDFAASWNFYRDVLGLTPGVGDARGPYAEFLWEGNARVGLFDRSIMALAVARRADPDPELSVGAFALILRTTDVDRTYADLVRRGVPFLQPPTDRTDWHLRAAHLADPDGNIIELYSELEDPR
ncbi:MAG: VOC family protein [Thermoplasmata archaeon]|nr:VOC family protein [Thermoplasmata archaeon]